MTAMPSPATPNVSALERRLNREIARGRLLRAYTRYYLPSGSLPAAAAGEAAESDVVLHFLEWADHYVAAAPLRSVVSGAVSRSEWSFPRGRSGRGAVRAVVRRWTGQRVTCESVRDVRVPGSSDD